MSDRQISILIVDDARFSSAVVDRTFTAAGYSRLRHASSAREALARLEEHPADLVVADWLMPEMDGLALTRHIRQLDEAANRYTYIILLTAREGVQALRTAFDEGVDDFVNKSAMSEQLLPRVMAAERLLRIHNQALADNQRLIEANARLRKHSTVDPLTGFGNRQYALRRLDEALRQADSRGGAACMLVLRINDLQSLDTQHGSTLAQQLVLALSRRLKQLVRPMDILARVTPDTFCLITHQMEREHCSPATFRRLYEGLNHHAYKTAGGFMQVSVSIAMSSASAADVDAASMLDRCMRGLEKSRENQRIIEQPVSS